MPSLDVRSPCVSLWATDNFDSVSWSITSANIYFQNKTPVVIGYTLPVNQLDDILILFPCLMKIISFSNSNRFFNF